MIRTLLFLFVLPSLILSAQSGPDQPVKGPGGSTYVHNKVRRTQYGENIHNWYWLYEPMDPKPDSTEVIIFLHGHTDNMDSLEVVDGFKLFCEHIAKKGYTVIYPMFQYGGYEVRASVRRVNTANVIKLALNRLETDPDKVRIKRWPDGHIKLGIVGFSLGAGTTLGCVNDYKILGLPAFGAVCVFSPGYARSLADIPPDTKIALISGSDDDLNGPKASSNAHRHVWNILSTHPCENRKYIMAYSDNHGTPKLKAKHDFCTSGKKKNDKVKLNALDYYSAWKWAVGILDCKFKDKNCAYVFGDKLPYYMGKWSDGKLVKPAVQFDSCMIAASNIVLSPRLEWYPNPTDGVLHLETSVLPEKIEVRSIEGRLLSTAYHTRTIDISMLPAALYLVRTEWTDKTVRTFKVVKH